MAWLMEAFARRRTAASSATPAHRLQEREVPGVRGLTDGSGVYSEASPVQLGARRAIRSSMGVQACTDAPCRVGLQVVNCNRLDLGVGCIRMIGGIAAATASTPCPFGWRRNIQRS